jgi:hypothetical protein
MQTSDKGFECKVSKASIIVADLIRPPLCTLVRLIQKAYKEAKVEKLFICSEATNYEEIKIVEFYISDI